MKRMPTGIGYGNDFNSIRADSSLYAKEEEGLPERLLRLNRVKVEIRPRARWRLPSATWLAVDALALTLGAVLAWVVMKWL